MNTIDYMLLPYKKIFNVKKYSDVFTGRASRAEFWYFRLFVVVMVLLLTLVDEVLIPNEAALFGSIFYFVTLLPDVAVSIRRLHDTGRSGWNFLWVVTIIGCIPVFYWLCKKATKGLISMEC